MLRRLTVVMALASACGTPSQLSDALEEPSSRIDVVDAVRSGDTGAPLSTHMTPYPHAALTFVLPEGAPEQTAPMIATASAGRVDLHLLIDSTGSFRGEISALQSTLTRNIIPSLRTRVPSMTIGVSSFEDMPFSPFGIATDRPFVLYAAQTSDNGIVDRGVFQIYQGDGGDEPEAWPEALYQVASGSGLVSNGRVLIQAFSPHALPDSGNLGGVGFRPQSTRVVVLITDAPGHDARDYIGIVNNAHSLAQAINALDALGVHVVGISSGADSRLPLESIAMATGAIGDPVGGVCRTGLGGTARPTLMGRCPLVFDLAPDGTGLSATVVESITELLDATVYGDVHGEADDPDGFVTAIEAVVANPATPREDRIPSSDADGIDDTFTSVHANTQLTFRLHVRNVSVAASEFPQVFFVPVRIVGDGTVLQELLIRVIVPEGPKFDAGFDVD